MSDLKIQGVVEVSTEGAESSLNRVGSAAESMSRKVETSANQAGKAVDSIGDGAGKSAEEFTRAEGKIVNSIKRATTQLEQLGKTASQKLDLKISTQGLDAAKFEPMLTKLRELESAQARVGVGSRGMGSQLQNTSYQLQDFIVQVNGGVDATKALGMQLPQMLVGFGAAGAAIGVVAALLPNLVQALDTTDKGVKKFGDAMSDFDKAIGDVGSTVKTFDMEKLYEQFNNSSKAVREATIEQLNFQKALIETERLAAKKSFGASLSETVDDTQWNRLKKTFSTSNVTMTSSYSDIIASDLGISAQLAKQLQPVLQDLRKGTGDVNAVFEEFGTKLLSGNQKAIDLAKTLAGLAKAERDGEAATKAIAEAQERMAKGHVTTKKEADEAAKAREKAAKAAEAEAKALETLLDSINGKSSQFDSSYVQNVETLLKAYGKGKLTLSEYNDVFARYIAMQPGAVAAAKELAKAEEARSKYLAGVEDETNKLIEKAKVAEYENSLIGKSADEIGRLTAARYDERIELLQDKIAAIEAVEGRNSEVESIERQIEALNRLKSAEIAKPKLQAQAREWEKFTDQINQSLTDALYRSFESGESFGKTFAKNLQNTFKSMVLKFAVQATMTTGGNLLNSAINYVAGTSGDNGGSGTNYLGLASNANSIYNLANAVTGFSNSVNTLATWLGAGSSVGASATSLAYANAVGAIGGDSLGALIAANGSWGGVSVGSSVAASAAAEEAAAAVAAETASSSIVPVVGWIVAALTALYNSNNLYKQGVTWNTFKDKREGTAVWYLDDSARLRSAFEKTTEDVMGKDFVNSELHQTLSLGSFAAAMHEWVATGLMGAERMVGSQTKGAFSEDQLGFSGQWGADMKKSGGLFSSSKHWTEWQQMPGQVDMLFDLMYVATRQGFMNLAGAMDDASFIEKLKGFSFDFQVGEADVETALKAAGTQLYEAMGKVLLPSIEGLRQTVTTNGQQITETWSQAFLRIQSESVAAANVFDALGKSISDSFGNSVDKVFAASDAFVKLFGSIDALNQSFNAYYENFYTSSEKTARSWELMQRSFDALDLSMPSTREGFRKLVDGLDLTTTNGQSTFKALMDLQGAFANLTPTLEDTVVAANAAAEAERKRIAEERYNLEGQLLQAQGDVAAIRARELATIDASNRALQERIWAIEDEKAAIDAANAALEEAKGGVSAAFSRLQESVSAEKQRIASVADQQKSAITAQLNAQQESYRAQIAAAQDAANEIKSIAAALSNAVKQTQIDSLSASAARYGQAQQVIEQAFSTGNIKLPGLTDALSIASEDNKKFFSTFEEYAFAQASTNAKIKVLSGTAESQLTAAEQTIKSLEASSAAAQAIAKAQLDAIDSQSKADQDALDAQLKQGEDQMNALLGIDNRVLSVADAVKGLAAAMAGYASAQAAATQSAIAAASSKSSAVSSAGGGGASSKTSSWFDGGGWLDAGTNTWHANVESSPWYAGPNGTNYSLNNAELTSIFGANNVPNTALSQAYGGALSVADWNAVKASADPVATYRELFGKIVGATSGNWSGTGAGAGESGLGIYDSSGALISVLVGNSAQEIAANAMQYYNVGATGDIGLAAAEGIVSSAISQYGAGTNETGMAIYESAVSLGLTASQIAEATGQTVEAINAWIDDRNLDPLDGSHATGLTSVPFDGYRAELHKGEAVISAPEVAAIRRYFGATVGGGNDAMVEELQALRKEVALLRQEAQATAQYTNKTARLLDRAMPDGDALATRVAA